VDIEVTYIANGRDPHTREIAIVARLDPTLAATYPASVLTAPLLSFVPAGMLGGYLSDVLHRRGGNPETTG